MSPVRTGMRRSLQRKAFGDECVYCGTNEGKTPLSVVAVPPPFVQLGDIGHGED